MSTDPKTYNIETDQTKQWSAPIRCHQNAESVKSTTGKTRNDFAEKFRKLPAGNFPHFTTTLGFLVY